MKIANIYPALDGEVSYKGPLHFTTIVRTGQCNLRCWKSSGFCDAPATLDMKYPYPQVTVEMIVSKCDKIGMKRVLITGGEPLLQADEVFELAKVLRYNGYVVTLETSGSIDMHPEKIELFNSVIADLKPPSTEMAHMMCTNLYWKLQGKDFIKVVIANRDDYVWAMDYINDLPMLSGGAKIRAQVAFGPKHGELDPRELIEWLKQDKRFDIQLNVQIHKYLYPELAVVRSERDTKNRNNPLIIDRERLTREEV